MAPISLDHHTVGTQWSLLVPSTQLIAHVLHIDCTYNTHSTSSRSTL